MNRRLSEIDDPAAQRRLVFAHLDCFDDAAAETLKNCAIRARLTNTQHALQMAELIQEAATVKANPRARGYGLWAEAIVRSLGLGEYQQALLLYDEAIAIFAAAGDELSPATMQISRLWSLANLNRLAEVFAVGEQAAKVLHRHGKWLQLATLQMNLGATYSRSGEDVKALAMFHAARTAYEELGGADNDEIAPLWAAAVNNSSISHSYLGDFEQALAQSQAALAVQERLGNRVEAARVKQRQGVTCFTQGRYNTALKLLQDARAVFMEDGLQRHAARLDLDICDCLLRLRRFAEVLPKSTQAQTIFRAAATLHEEALAVLYTAMAHAGLQQDARAVEALTQAGALFAQENSSVWVAYTHLEQAGLLYRQGRYAESLALAHACAERFQQENLPVKAGEAQIQVARALMALDNRDTAYKLLHTVCVVGRERGVADLTYRAYHALGNLAHTAGDSTTAAERYAAAITALEGLRGQLMVEYRVNFQEDKQIVYEDMVRLCLEMDEPAQGLAYAERAKSRALLDLLDYRVDLRLRPRSAADRSRVEQLLALRAERDRRYRRWENHERVREQDNTLFHTASNDAENLRQLEQQIAELWHTLLIHNADYAHDAALWQVQTHDVQPDIDDDTVLLEYYSVRGQLFVFVVERQTVRAYALGVALSDVRIWIERLGRQMRAVPRFPPHGLPALTRQTQVILQTLYAALVAPIAEIVARYSKVTIVPHDALHYLPFHALYDGQCYWVEQCAIHYLPNAGLLQHQRDRPPAPTRLLAVGYSANGALPNVHQELATIAGFFPTTWLSEADATQHRLRELAPRHSILHLATHAEMHDQQPLFSGLLLEDSWLTTLDIFNLELDADLVTLSACQTGRSAIGGGDELLGLMRAFLYAGADSLVLSMWAVEDRATAELMGEFYAKLAQGWDKSAALRHAQRSLIQPATARDHGHTQSAPYAHPYFWAPFFLVGDPGALAPHASS